MPESYLLDRDGKKILDLESQTAQASQKLAMAEPVKMKAADGKPIFMV